VFGLVMIGLGFEFRLGHDRNGRVNTRMGW
jgi:hypothetical protein